MINRGKPNTQENLFQCHFDLHESHMKSVGIELGYHAEKPSSKSLSYWKPSIVMNKLMSRRQ
jgi:hypothetical protein